MLFFPYSTDAPIYHYPIATGTIVALNVMAYTATTIQVATGNLSLDDVKWLALTFDGIHPLQWITHCFLHIHPFQLIVNMLFLWSFGLVIEGKIGGLLFSIIYFATHIFCGALAQCLFYALSFAVPAVSEMTAVGADNGIYVMMAMALMWAPENEMNCMFLLLVPRLGKMGGGIMTELKIATLATAYLFIELIMFFFLGLLVWQAGFHLMSLMIGVVLAFVMLRMEWVDCEDWDIISRNEWLHGYTFLCSDERRERLAEKVDVRHDAVSMALATSSTASTSNASYMAARSTTMARSAKGEATTIAPRNNSGQAGTATTTTAPTPNSGKDGKGKRRGLLGLKGKAPAPPPSPQQIAEAHPDFNRIAMLLRQSLSTRSLMLAEQHFGKLQQLGLAPGLADKTLFDFASLLASEKKYLPALTPLQLIVEHGGPMSADALIRVAQIQLKVMRLPGEAVKTLRKIRFPAETAAGAERLSEAQKKIITRRNALLEQCGVQPPPLIAKPDGPK
ncbi:membrane associated rhomboid family serine protease [Rhodopirellula rubra]|uniref:Membrane associated rhomboid family serine protease n=1 Tax=Aporhodopirellula rubra TaxID=980271 RepID=A0A7W5DW65_9BACT|nr:rhomboid family intramembrane serine protease [Aporhodopirellula rubra]MBB3205616.1 membrane associated rhomboid family serine protease [Aporhodopirellula rubra]